VEKEGSSSGSGKEGSHLLMCLRGEGEKGKKRISIFPRSQFVNREEGGEEKPMMRKGGERRGEGSDHPRTGTPPP